MIKKPKKLLQIGFSLMAMLALLVAPASTVMAHGERSGSDGQDAARQFSRQKHDNRDSQGWWNDWRYGDNKKDWEDWPQTCEQRQDAVDRKASRLERSAKSQLEKIDWQIDFQKWYVDRHELQPAGFSEMTTAAEVNETEARAAIEAYESPELDCEQPVSNDKTLLQQSKQAMLLALRDFHVDGVNITYAVQMAK